MIAHMKNLPTLSKLFVLQSGTFPSIPTPSASGDVQPWSRLQMLFRALRRVATAGLNIHFSTPAISFPKSAEINSDTEHPKTLQDLWSDLSRPYINMPCRGIFSNHYSLSRLTLRSQGNSDCACSPTKAINTRLMLYWCRSPYKVYTMCRHMLLWLMSFCRSRNCIT